MKIYYLPIKPTLTIHVETEKLIPHELKRLEITVDQYELIGYVTCPHCGTQHHFHLIATEGWRKCKKCNLYMDEEDGGQERLAQEKLRLQEYNAGAINGLMMGMELSLRTFGAAAAKLDSMVGIATEHIDKGQLVAWDPQTGRIRPANFKEDCDYGNP